ncbi:lipid-phosphate phosphatase-like protein [Microdochium nivale]|nr:lipid-phosphate phosphatase-like protein [Microdochium nivale]
MRSSLTLAGAILAALGPAVAAAATTKQFTTSDGVSYTYDHSPAADPARPTFFLFHGFPSTRHDWAPQVTALEAAGFGVLAPDMLGSGGSDKPDPADLSAYRWSVVSDHMAELIDAAGVRPGQRVIGVGHDWGTSAMARAYNYHPARFSHLVFMSAAYTYPGGFLDVDAVNARALAATGLVPGGYWYFFNHYTAPDVISSHLESFYSLIYTANSSTQNRDFAHLGAARAWLTADKIGPLAAWDTEAHRDEWLRQFRQPGAVAGSLNTYRRVFAGTDVADNLDPAIMPEENKLLNVPVTIIGGTLDTITPGAGMRAQMQRFARARLDEYQLQGGHWLGLENAEEVNAILLRIGGGA